jgi:hypothetical protein
MARICRQAGCARDRGGNDAAVGEGGGAKGMKLLCIDAIHLANELGKALGGEAKIHGSKLRGFLALGAIKPFVNSYLAMALENPVQLRRERAQRLKAMRVAMARQA